MGTVGGCGLSGRVNYVGAVGEVGGSSTWGSRLVWVKWEGKLCGCCW